MTLPEKPDSVIDWKHHEKVQPLHAPGCPASICTCGAALAMTQPPPGVGPALSALIERLLVQLKWAVSHDAKPDQFTNNIAAFAHEAEAALSALSVETPQEQRANALRGAVFQIWSATGAYSHEITALCKAAIERDNAALDALLAPPALAAAEERKTDV